MVGTRGLTGPAAVIWLLAIVGVATMSDAQDTNAWPDARPADVESIDAMMEAAYRAVSAKRGEERDLERFRSLWRRGSRLMAAARADGGVIVNVLSLDDFVQAFSGPVDRGVYERELSRRTEVFGNMAHVWSAYEVREAPEGEVRTRGINSLQLVHDGRRWWFVAGLFQNEEADLPLPSSYAGHEPP